MCGLGRLVLLERFSKGVAIRMTLRVCNLVDESGNWDWNRLSNLILDQILLQIASLVPPSLDAGPDRLAWKWMTKDIYSMAKTYRNVYPSEAGDFPKVWKMIWKDKTPQMVQVFLWLLWQDRFLKNGEWARQIWLMMAIVHGAVMLMNLVSMQFVIALFKIDLALCCAEACLNGFLFNEF